MSTEPVPEARRGQTGNTATVCRKCYVHPAVVEAYLDRSLLKQLLDRPSWTDGSNVGIRPQITQNEHRIPGWSHHYSDAPKQSCGKDWAASNRRKPRSWPCCKNE
jgi:hypothetical protein